MKTVSTFTFTIILLFCCKFAFPQDWLIKPIKQKAQVKIEGNTIELNNGLVKRRFIISQNLACFDYINLTNNQQLIRAIKPEARLKIDGKEYNIGGLIGQTEQAYLQTDWLQKLKKGKTDFVYKNFEISEIKPRINWKSKSWPNNTQNPSGQTLVLWSPSNMKFMMAFH
jgi:hypothetical protein